MNLCESTGHRCIPGTKSLIMWRFDFFYVSLMNLLDEQSSCRWFQTSWPSCDLPVMPTHHCVQCTCHFGSIYIWHLHRQRQVVIISRRSFWQLHRGGGTLGTEVQNLSDRVNVGVGFEAIIEGYRCVRSIGNLGTFPVCAGHDKLRYHLNTYKMADKLSDILKFHQWKVFYFHSNCTQFCSQESNWQKFGIGSHNGSRPNKRQAITSTNADPILWRIHAPPSMLYRADSRFAPSQWETSLQSNAVSHWLDAKLESALL